jgi:hypothetical protein
MTKRHSLSIDFEDETGRRWSFVGREAWALAELVRAGERGCTPINHPGPRWSAYVFKLRGAGVDIETRHEPHGAPFTGNHARYILKTQLRIVESEAA